MSRDQIFEKLIGIFRDVFDDDLSINDNTTAADIEDWDSLSHIMLLTAIEDQFGIKLDMRAVQELDNVGEMINLIEKAQG